MISPRPRLAGEVYVVGGARTPMTDYVGALRDVAAPDLGAAATKAALTRTGIRPESVDHVVFGHVLPTGGGGIYHTRHMALKAGLPIEVPALAVNRLCGSGLQAAISGAHLILSGDADIVLTGGMESMSQTPHAMHGLRSGLRLGQGTLQDSLWAALNDSHAGCSMAATAENCAAAYGISREAQDAFALRSHQAAARAWALGRFDDEVAAVEWQTRKGVQRVTSDDHVRPDASLEAMAKLPSAIAGAGTVTAGNASGIVDGAAAVLLASRRAVESHGLRPIARIVTWATAGVEPTLMGMGPVPATRQALQRADLSLGDVTLFEVNEAFSGQYLAVEQELSLDRELVNVNGGAIALGHPLGMTGARQLLTLCLELRRRGGGRGVATACIGGGQGIAVVTEALP
jgi:acetyl-CoA acetyltransferase family protein